jgi:hypothetical protein
MRMDCKKRVIRHGSVLKTDFESTRKSFLFRQILCSPPNNFDSNDGIPELVCMDVVSSILLRIDHGSMSTHQMMATANSSLILLPANRHLRSSSLLYFHLRTYFGYMA